MRRQRTNGAPTTDFFSPTAPPSAATAVGHELLIRNLDICSELHTAASCTEQLTVSAQLALAIVALKINTQLYKKAAFLPHVRKLNLGLQCCCCCCCPFIPWIYWSLRCKQAESATRCNCCVLVGGLDGMLVAVALSCSYRRQCQCQCQSRIIIMETGGSKSSFMTTDRTYNHVTMIFRYDLVTK